MQLEVLTPSKKLFSGLAKQIKVPGSLGYLGVLDLHTAFSSSLKPGEVTIEKENGENLKYSTKGGMLFVDKNTVSLLSDSLEEIK